MGLLCVLAALLFAAVSAVAARECRWAPTVNASALLDPESPELGRVFGLIGQSEAPFVRGVGVASGLGVTRDGTVLNYTTGEAAQLHDFSAASKEGFHLALAARCIAEFAEALGGGRPRLSGSLDPGVLLARRQLLGSLCGSSSTGRRDGLVRAAEYWMRTLEAKLDSFARFNSSFPGFGGFLPWFSVPANGSGAIGLLQGWENRVPALDNGEMFWGVVAAGQAARRFAGAASAGSGLAHLAASADSLAGRLETAWAAMASNARALFWGGAGSSGAVFAVTTVGNVSEPPGQSPISGTGRLDDPFEGELFTWVVDLLTGLDAAEREALWVAKRPQLQAVPYRMPSGLVAAGGAAATVTVQRGFWFSAHEQMKGLYLPYTDASLVPTSSKVLRACEVARAADSAARRVPGLFASVTDVAAVPPSAAVPPVIPDYISASGIAALASQPIQRRDVVTPYGAMAMALVAPREAAVWYAHSLAATAMQGPLGSTAACNVNGTEIAPVATWDSKSSTLLGLLGGVGDLTGEVLASLPDRDGASKLDRFREVTEREMQRVFGMNVPGSDSPIALPTAAVPRTAGLRDFVAC